MSDPAQPHDAPAPARPLSPRISLALTVLAVALALFILTSLPLGRAGEMDASTVVPPSRFAEMAQTFAPVSFSLLSGFFYGDPPGLSEAETGRRPDPIPPQVLALDGRQVAVAGFMLPLDYDGTGVSEFLLNASYDMCYFGAPTRPNDFIVVRMSGGRRTEFVHTPIVVFGTLTVREERSRDRVVSLYTMEAEGVGFIPQ